MGIWESAEGDSIRKRGGNDASAISGGGGRNGRGGGLFAEFGEIGQHPAAGIQGLVNFPVPELKLKQKGDLPRWQSREIRQDLAKPLDPAWEEAGGTFVGVDMSLHGG